MVDLGMLDGKSAVMGSPVGPGNPLEKDSFPIYLACGVILLVLVLPYWMVPLNFAIIPSHLPERSLLGGFLRVDMFRGLLRVLGSSNMHLMFEGVWALMGGVLFVKVSKGSDFLRKLLVQQCTKFPQGQFRMKVVMTLWEMDLLGQEGWWSRSSGSSCSFMKPYPMKSSA